MTTPDNSRTNDSATGDRPFGAIRIPDREGKERLANAGIVDNQCFLSCPFLPSKVFVLLAAACLGWIGLLSLAFVFFMGTGVSAGWIFAGALVLALAIWAVVMFGEFRRAIDLTQAAEPDVLEDCELQSALDAMSASAPSGTAEEGTDRAFLLDRRHKPLRFQRRSRPSDRPDRSSAN